MFCSDDVVDVSCISYMFGGFERMAEKKFVE